MTEIDVSESELHGNQQWDAFTEDGVLHLPREGTLPTELCVRCGRKSVQVVTKPVRDPWNPLSWYAPRTPLEIGLCSKHRDDRRVGLALMYSLLFVGFIFTVFGIAIGNVSMMLLGLISAAVSGFFRAKNVIHGTESEENLLQIKGAGKHFLSRFPAKNELDEY